MTKSNNTPLRRTQRDYSLGFKLQAVDALEKGDMTDKQAQKFMAFKVVQPWLLG
ncbi:hypothetical protein HHL01_07280 [Pseudoalteromonas arctica]|uniref:Transposase n=1 Tax=Pseudoalteromonas arctica TaxID=394751 RepID=A0A7X9YFS5_9GAMM|nr:hypothetical protein [Pseudoalteromonas arctica]